MALREDALRSERRCKFLALLALNRLKGATLMTKLNQLAPALSLATALLCTAVPAANAQDITPAATQQPATIKVTGHLMAAAFHGGGMQGGWRDGGGGHLRRGWGGGPLFGLGDETVIAPDIYAYGSGCGIYRVRWHQTGLSVWRSRYYDCVYG
jgi:hypothetical protein